MNSFRLRNISVLAAFIAALFVPALVMAQPPKATPPATAARPAQQQSRERQMLNDFGNLARFREANLQLGPPAAGENRVVFMGDSITQIWDLQKFFPGKPYVNRGISGQTTPQMMVRMFPDVIDLTPDAVILLAGTNDIARNTGPETAKMIEENYQAITELARIHDIRVILCSLTPVSDYTAHPQTARRPPAQILELNAWIKSYAARAHATFADYYSALVDSKGMLRDGYSKDGLHPDDRGFALLAPVAEAAIEEALHEKP